MPTSVFRSGLVASQTAGGGSITVAIPSGTPAGALAILTLAGSTYYGPGSITTPSGWTVRSAFTEVSSTPYYSSAVFSKVLSSADITAGSVTVTVSTNYGLNPLSPHSTALQGHMYTITHSRFLGGVATVTNTAAGNLAADPAPPVDAVELMLGVVGSGSGGGIVLSGTTAATTGWSSAIANPISVDHPNTLVSRWRTVNAGATDQPYFPATYDIVTTAAIFVDVEAGWGVGKLRFGTRRGL